MPCAFAASSKASRTFSTTAFTSWVTSCFSAPPNAATPVSASKASKQRTARIWGRAERGEEASSERERSRGGVVEGSRLTF